MGVLFASMPLAWLGAKVEGMLREQERGSYNKLLTWTRNPLSSSLPSTLVFKSLIRTFVASSVVFYVSVLVLFFTFQTLFALKPGLLASIDITWAHLWVAATMGGLMALRLKRAYGVLATCITLVALFMLWPSF